MSITASSGTNGSHIHRRKSSREEDDNVVVIPSSPPAVPTLKTPPIHEFASKTNGNGISPSSNGDFGDAVTSLKASNIISSNGGNGVAGYLDPLLSERPRVNSTPSAPQPIPQVPVSPSYPLHHPPSAGPYRTSFAAASRPPPLNSPFNPHRHQPPALRQSFSLPAHSSRDSHSRNRSVSGPFSPISPSPLSVSFPPSISEPHQVSNHHHARTFSSSLASSSTAPELHNPFQANPSFSNSSSNVSGMTPSTSTSSSSSASSSSRRHSRLHSRNLSIYFPRPGSIPSTSIAEDGTQEIDFSPSASSLPSGDSGVLMPSVSSPGPGQRSFREGFTFGARPPSHSLPMPEMIPSKATVAARRGHHHKHSLSHNFFSFLEPGQHHSDEDLHTSPTPTPVSPWAPSSTIKQGDEQHTHDHSHGHHDHSHSHSHPKDCDDHQHEHHEHDHDHDHSHSASHSHSHSPHSHGHTSVPSKLVETSIGSLNATPHISPIALSMSVVQFVLGAMLWVQGQQIGSLSCTGLGYWVVFDSFGLFLRRVLPNWLEMPSMKDPIARQFGNARAETLAIYAQSIYLVFASVYVFKEMIEHLLLSSGEGHHHHAGDEVTDIFGIEFPPVLLSTILLSLLVSAIGFDNHAKIASIAGNHIPPIPSLLPSRYRYRSSLNYTYPTYLANLLSNPYTLSPVLFCASILYSYIFLPKFRHRPFDLYLACIESIVTFILAYAAAVKLGAVLLQTAPSRGLPGGRMEAFLRAMREIERHPQIMHLPAPHIWQLTPTLIRPDGYGARHVKSLGPTQRLIVTISLHVQKDLDDGEVLKLTKWAWEKCMNGLRLGNGDSSGIGECEALVNVGIVRG